MQRVTPAVKLPGTSGGEAEGSARGRAGRGGASATELGLTGLACHPEPFAALRTSSAREPKLTRYAAGSSRCIDSRSFIMARS